VGGIPIKAFWNDSSGNLLSGYPVCSESQPSHPAAILSPIVQQELLSLQDDGFPITAFGNDALGGLPS